MRASLTGQIRCQSFLDMVYMSSQPAILFSRYLTSIVIPSDSLRIMQYR